MTPERRHIQRRQLLSLATLLLVPLAPHLLAAALGLGTSPVWRTALLNLPSADPLLPGLPGFLDLNAGWTTQALGTLAARDWLGGHIPWWDPYAGVGLPLAAEMQSAALFLPYILLLALPGGTTLLTLALQWTAGLATWRLLLRLGLSPLAATTGAALFELGAPFAWVGPPANLPMAFLPLFLLGIERARTGRAGLVTAAVALSVYAGFPETAYLDGLLALAWALLRAGPTWAARLATLSRVAVAGAASLLLAAPLLGPFFDYLPTADLGPRDAVDMAALSIPLPGLSQLLTPYALGLPAGLSDSDPSGLLFTLWGRAGGYLGTGLALAALAGALAGPNRTLRLFLAGWTALFLARLFGLPPAGAVFALLPLHGQIQVFRYATAAWTLPACILAAHALDGRPTRSQIAVAAAAILALAIAGLTVAWPVMQSIPTGPAYLLASAAYAALSLLAVTAAFARGHRRAAAVLLVADAALLLIVPFAAALPHPRLDRSAIGFLRAHLGLARFATLEPFQPNYAGLFGLASVNSNVLPAPAAWSRTIETRLQPGSNGVMFNGVFPPVRPGEPNHAQLLAAHLPNYTALGVRYVLTPFGTDPFGTAPRWPGPHAIAVTVDPGQSVTGTLPPGEHPAASLAVIIGTFAGRADGTLSAELCSPTGCAHGAAPLAGARDNTPLVIPLDRPVAAAAQWRLTHTGTFPVAIWQTAAQTFEVVPIPPPAADAPALAHAAPSLDIYELADPAPYWSTSGGPCQLTPRSRTALDATCDTPATLTRRELFAPGWTATAANGQSLPISPADPLFQSVPLPPGASAVAFSYVPPHIHLYAALFAGGLLLSALPLIRRPQP